MKSVIVQRAQTLPALLKTFPNSTNLSVAIFVFMQTIEAEYKTELRKGASRDQRDPVLAQSQSDVVKPRVYAYDNRYKVTCWNYNRLLLQVKEILDPV